MLLSALQVDNYQMFLFLNILETNLIPYDLMWGEWEEKQTLKFPDFTQGPASPNAKEKPIMKLLQLMGCEEFDRAVS